MSNPGPIERVAYLVACPAYCFAGRGKVPIHTQWTVPIPTTSAQLPGFSDDRATMQMSQTEESGRPWPKPRRIGLADEAGTGMPKIVSAWRQLGFRLPEIETG